MKLLTVIVLCALAIGCGYGSHSMAAPGVAPTISSFNPPNATAATVAVTVTNPGTGGIYGTTATTSQPMNFTIQ